MLWLLPHVQPGDCVILNAANSTVGQTLIQLCHILRLRCIAVMRGGTLEEEKREKLTLWLKSLGATEVCFEDQAKPLKVRNPSSLSTPA
jgi:trans-2-enoyl-CoA reductase